MTRKLSARRWAPPVVGALTLSLALAACGGSDGDSGGSGGSADSFSFMALNENTTQDAVITSLSENECTTENEALPLDVTKQAQDTVDQQEQLLAGQDALPSLFPANTPSLVTELTDAGQVGDLGTGLSDASAIVPAASGAVDNIFGSQVVLPTELNIEGIWFNKQLLADNGIEVPTTWDELVAAFATLKDAGVQPISNAGSGGDGWGVTRWVGAYLYRTLGPDALQAVADGDASLTDDDYVAAADAIAELGKAGYFGPSPTSIDYQTALNTFLNGDAAFIYMGSWALADFNDPEANKIGEDNVGFLPFPEVQGGAGSADQTPTNVGTSLVVSADALESEDGKAWVQCIADNYGTAALRDHGQITGLKVEGDVDVPPLTQLVQDQIASTQDPVLWFEALFPASATTVSQQNGGLLGAGQLSGADFMSTVSNELG